MTSSTNSGIKNLKCEPILNCLSDKEKAEFLSKLFVRRYQKDQYIFQVGDPAGGLFYLFSGELRVEFDMVIGENCVGGVYRKKTWFGELSVMTGNPRIMSVIATKNSTLFCLGYHDAQNLIANCPQVLKVFSLITQKHLRSALNSIANLMIRDAKKRLIAILLQLGEGPEATHLEDCVNEIVVSQDEIAVMSNLARSTVNMMLQELQLMGLVDIQYKKITILNYNALRKILISDKNLHSKEDIKKFKSDYVPTQIINA